jgi:hypothetical protein
MDVHSGKGERGPKARPPAAVRRRAAAIAGYREAFASGRPVRKDGLGRTKAAILTRTAELPGGTRRIVHVAAAELKARMEGLGRPALCGVRDADEPDGVLYCRHVEILGPSWLWDQDDPDALPGTGGRGVCYLVTDSALRLHFDAEGECDAAAMIERAGATVIGTAARRACEEAGL